MEQQAFEIMLEAVRQKEFPPLYEQTLTLEQAMKIENELLMNTGRNEFYDATAKIYFEVYVRATLSEWDTKSYNQIKNN